MTEVIVNNYLTWEYCEDPDIQYLECPAPQPMQNFLPNWFKELKGNFSQYDQDGDSFMYTIRHCLGFQGVLGLGYTIPLPETIDGYDTKFSQGRLHPEMMHGTRFANRLHKRLHPGDNSFYEYRFKLLHWPWRAKMAKGWRLIILPYLLDWPADWQEFPGAVQPNYDVHSTHNQIGSWLQWNFPFVPARYNYYNIETVVALRRNTTIEKGTVTFCALPFFDPELYEKQK